MKWKVLSLLTLTVMLHGIMIHGVAQAAVNPLLEQAREVAAAASAGGDEPNPDDALWHKALHLGEAALEAAPQDADTLRFLAESYFTVGWYSRAWESWSWQRYRLATGDLDPLALESVSRAGQQLGYARYLTGDYDGAIAYYKSVLDLNPDVRKAYAWLGRIYLETGDPATALLYGQAVLAFDPTDANAQYFAERAEAAARYGEAPQAFYRGLNLYTADESFAARLAFVEATETHPSYAEAWAWLGRTRLEQMSYPLAQRAFERAVALEPENESYRYWAAEARRFARQE